MFIKKNMLLLILIIICSSVILTCTKEEAGTDDALSFRIGYSLFYGSNPFVIAMLQGAEQCIKDWKEKNVSVQLIVTKGSDTDPTRQITDCEDLYTRNIQGLLIFPGAGSKIMSGPVKKLFNANNIPVVVTDIGLSDAEWVSFITTDNAKGGTMLANLLAEYLPENSSVITFDSSPSTENCILRQQAFEETSRALGFQVLPEKVLNKNLEDGRRVMEDVLIAYPGLDAIFHINQLTAQGSIANNGSQPGTSPLHVAFDIDSSSLEMVKEGRILGLIVQDPFLMGYEGMNQMLRHLTGEPTERFINIPPRLCTKENADDFAGDPQVSQ